jgi:hypothetical protein
MDRMNFINIPRLDLVVITLSISNSKDMQEMVSKENDLLLSLSIEIEKFSQFDILICRYQMNQRSAS